VSRGIKIDAQEKMVLRPCIPQRTMGKELGDSSLEATANRKGAVAVPATSATF